MKTTELQAQARETVGKKENKALRNSGQVPAVLYNNSEATHIYVDYKELQPILFARDTYIIKLNVDGKASNAIIREAQYHPVTEKILHVDFLQVTDEKPVVLTLPVNLVGSPVGVSKGGKLVTKLRRIKVKGIPSQLPEKVEINVSQLDLGQTIKIVDANIQGLEIVTNASTGVASVEIPRALRSAGAAKAAAGE
ncbi:MAG: 50S ribosomal protein L25 [Bacteroidetes bacterium]|nr:50S ribosomal protein L25 [Bacteroidota bacterium]MCB0851200.1 50S ribosomal protein L25 [Bacteroidota bacterium]